MIIYNLHYISLKVCHYHHHQYYHHNHHHHHMYHQLCISYDLLAIQDPTTCEGHEYAIVQIGNSYGDDDDDDDNNKR